MVAVFGIATLSMFYKFILINFVFYSNYSRQVPFSSTQYTTGHTKALKERNYISDHNIDSNISKYKGYSQGCINSREKFNQIAMSMLKKLDGEDASNIRSNPTPQYVSTQSNLLKFRRSNYNQYSRYERPSERTHHTLPLQRQTLTSNSFKADVPEGRIIIPTKYKEQPREAKPVHKNVDMGDRRSEVQPYYEARNYRTPVPTPPPKPVVTEEKKQAPPSESSSSLNKSLSRISAGDIKYGARASSSLHKTNPQRLQIKHSDKTREKQIEDSKGQEDSHRDSVKSVVVDDKQKKHEVKQQQQQQPQNDAFSGYQVKFFKGWLALKFTTKSNILVFLMFHKAYCF